MYGTRNLLLKLVLLVAVVAAAVLFVRMRKEALVREGANFLQNLLSRETKLDVKIGKISGKITGVVRFDDVRFENPGLPEGARTLFTAKRLEFRYDPWEFFTKNFGAKIRVNVTGPQLYLRPSVRLRSEPFPFFGWLRDLLLTQHRHVALRVKDLTVYAGLDGIAFPGISLTYDDDKFEASMPVRHLDFFGNDVSTEAHLRGSFEWGATGGQDRVEAQFTTEASVVNWQPLPWESRVDFTLMRDRVTVDSSNLLGGFELSGGFIFDGEAEADLKVRTVNYPLKNFELLFGGGQTGSYDGTLNLEARLSGPPDLLKTQIDALLTGGRMEKGHYRSMVLHASGVYPTLTLSDSHVTTEDGVQMRFADKTVEFFDLFSSRTFRGLVNASAQDNVSFGDWGFKRPFDENQQPEFLMERSLGQRARVQFRKYNEEEPDRKILEPVNEEESRDVEVGFQFRLQPDSALKYTVREDEQFLGVEKKMSF